ncbi:MAG: NAD(+)/NADH kinase [Armatimonadetes bacterium]|nr:NAD(+)/NADH kinase [Armatimonadota bacterium]
MMLRPIRTFGLAARTDTHAVRLAMETLARELTARGAEVRVEQRWAEAAPGAQAGDRDFLLSADAIISLGGDGTFLAVARQAAERDTPVLGIDLGSFGFLADEPLETVVQRVDELMAGNYAIEERMMLEAVVTASDGEQARFLALNDVVVGRAPTSGIVRLRCEVDGSLLAVYPGDGVIFATPTGSTAYSLSAGGPIVDPTLECFLVVAICPHTLYSRPLVIDATRQVTVRREPQAGRSQDQHVSVIADGHDVAALSGAACVTIQRAESRARIIHLTPRTFFDRLREKLNWGAPR